MDIKLDKVISKVKTGKEYKKNVEFQESLLFSLGYFKYKNNYLLRDILKRENIKISKYGKFCVDLPSEIKKDYSINDKVCGTKKENENQLLLEIVSQFDFNEKDFIYEGLSIDNIGKNKFIINLNEDKNAFNKINILGHRFDFYLDIIKNYDAEFDKYSHMVEKLKNGKYKIHFEEGRGGEYTYFFDKKGNIETDLGEGILYDGYLGGEKYLYICGEKKKGYIYLNLNSNWDLDKSIEIIKMKNFKYTGYSICGNLYTISNEHFKKLGDKREIIFNKENFNKILNYSSQGKFGPAFKQLGGGTFRYNNVNLIEKDFYGYKIKFFKNNYQDNYSYLIYNKKGELLEIAHQDGLDGSASAIYITFINGKKIEDK